MNDFVFDGKEQIKYFNERFLPNSLGCFSTKIESGAEANDESKVSFSKTAYLPLKRAHLLFFVILLVPDVYEKKPEGI